MLKDQTMKLEMKLKLAIMRQALKKRYKNNKNNNPNILLTGPARSGKSILSRRLETDLNYIPFRMDSIGGYAKAYADPEKRQQRMSSIITDLLTDFPNDLCIEGSTSLRGGNYNYMDNGSDEKFFRFIARSKDMTEQQKRDAFIMRHSEISLDSSLKIANDTGTKLVLIGSLEEPELKAEGMMKHRAAGKCWSSKYCTDLEVYYLALDNHICSQHLKALSIKHGLLFIDIKSSAFVNSVLSGVEKIRSLLNT